MRVPYEYAFIRVVPCVEREEFVNVGVLVFCESQALLRVSVELDEVRLKALCPRVEMDLVRRYLSGYERVCRGGTPAGAVGSMSPRERWRWLTAPRNTILQTSPAHGGLSEDLEALIERMMDLMVRCPKGRDPQQS